MGKFRHASVVQRIAISVIALYALLLQGFLAAPVTAFASDGEVTCVTDISGPGSAGGEHNHHRGLCCIVACSAFCTAYVASLAGLIDFPIRQGSRVGFGETQAGAALAPLEFYFAARGPPQNV